MGSKTSLSEKISATRLMVNGLKSQSDAVAKVGITAEKACDLEKLMNEVISLDNEQENLKAALKSKTTELDEKVKVLNAEMSSLRKLVKVAVAKDNWVSFGISATK